jgi:hypothetical protein
LLVSVEQDDHQETGIMRNESAMDIEVIYPAYGGEEDEPPVHSDFTKPPCTYGNDMQRSPTRFDSEDRRMLVTGILVAIMIVLSILLCYLVVPLICDYLRAKIPVSESRKERRYQTIEGWLVSKVRQHDRGTVHANWFARQPSDSTVVYLFLNCYAVDDDTNGPESPRSLRYM